MEVKILEDDELQDAIRHFISGTLPHENYNADYYSENLNALLRYVHLEELCMEYYVLVFYLLQMNKVKASVADFRPLATEKAFTDFLNVHLGEAVLHSHVRMKEFLEYERLQSNLQVQTVRQEATQLLYSRCITLYKDCYDLQIRSEDVLNFEPTLKAAFIGHVGHSSVVAQAKILQGNYNIGGKIYSGFDAWLNYTNKTLSELQGRLSSAEDNTSLCIDDLTKVNQLCTKVKENQVVIANYGIPELDGSDDIVLTPMLRHRLVVVVGSENIGKTMFAKDVAVNALLNGARVLFMCGENTKEKMYTELMVNYIYKRYNIFTLPVHISNPEECRDDVAKIINMAKLEVIDKQALILRNEYSYDHIYDELEADYQRYKMDVIVIDHSFALSGGYAHDNGKTNIDMLSAAVKRFRKQYPVFVMVTSHPAASVKDDLVRDTPIMRSPTRGSGVLSEDADEVFILRDNEILRKEGLIALSNYKRRNCNKIEDNIILKKEFAVSHFHYDTIYQATSTSLGADADQAIKDIESLYSFSDDDDYIL